jgi:hypothetical protein
LGFPENAPSVDRKGEVEPTIQNTGNKFIKRVDWNFLLTRPTHYQRGARELAQVIDGALVRWNIAD